MRFVFDDEESGQWYLNAPFEFLAGNWILCLRFGDGRLVGYRVGTFDNLLVAPKAAPAARGLN